MFSKCLKWAFQVCLKRFPVGRGFLEVKKIIKVKFLWIVADTDGRFYEWSVCSSKNTPKGCFSWDLEFVAVPKWFLNGFLYLYSSKQLESVLWYKLNGIKDFLKTKQYFLYWIRHRYQSKTCVEHIEQAIDKSLINSTNSSKNLLYFLHMMIICFKYSKKCMRS